MQVAALESERSIRLVPEADRRIRERLVTELMDMPDEMITRLRILQPEVGCFNRCSFCSQSAGTVISCLDARGLANLFAALKTVALAVASRRRDEVGRPYLPGPAQLTEEGVFPPGFAMPPWGLLGFERYEQRPGVIYPYLDNDIGSYPLLDRYIQYAAEDCGAKIRLSSVGYSRHNSVLQAMHERINRDLLHALGGVRFSLTPYTLGWTAQGERSGRTSRQEYILDFANALRTYAPAVHRLGSGDRAACVEFRFPPLAVRDKPVAEMDLLGRHAIHCGPYLLISELPGESLSLSSLSEEQRHKLLVRGELVQYRLILSQGLVDRPDWPKFAEAVIQNGLEPFEPDRSRCVVRSSKVFLVENDDGPYYAVDPEMTPDGLFAKQFYPWTEKRQGTGYIDSERYFLNAICAHKRLHNIGRRSPWPEASSYDMWAVLESLVAQAGQMATIDPTTSAYISEQVVPLVGGYCKILEAAGYSPAYFFDPGFTIDTGSICNMGRAFSEYRGLASKPQMAVTPQHERAYGRQSSLAWENRLWRLSPAALQRAEPGAVGVRTVATAAPSLMIEEHDYRQTATEEGQLVQRWLIPFEGIAGVRQGGYAIPGERMMCWEQGERGGDVWAEALPLQNAGGDVGDR